MCFKQALEYSICAGIVIRAKITSVQTDRYLRLSNR